MIAADEAVAFIRRNGNPLDQLRLRRALDEPFTPTEAEEILGRYQFPAGSWDYKAHDQASDHVGSLGGTIHCLRWVREFGLSFSQMMMRTTKFLESIQSPDGSFYETEEKLAHSPHGWLQEETIIDRFFFTAAVPMRLCSLGYQERAFIEPAIRWLECHWTDWKLITGTWYNLWAILCIYPLFGRLSASQYQRCYAAALDWLPNLDPQPLTWLLDALQAAGFAKEEPLVTQGITRLLDLLVEKDLCSGRKYSK